jgi:hypothetical protein
MSTKHLSELMRGMEVKIRKQHESLVASDNPSRAGMARYAGLLKLKAQLAKELAQRAAAAAAAGIREARQTGHTAAALQQQQQQQVSQQSGQQQIDAATAAALYAPASCGTSHKQQQQQQLGSSASLDAASLAAMPVPEPHTRSATPKAPGSHAQRSAGSNIQKLPSSTAAAAAASHVPHHLPSKRKKPDCLSVWGQYRGLAAADIPPGWHTEVLAGRQQSLPEPITAAAALDADTSSSAAARPWCSAPADATALSAMGLENMSSRLSSSTGSGIGRVFAAAVRQQQQQQQRKPAVLPASVTASPACPAAAAAAAEAGVDGDPDHVDSSDAAAAAADVSRGKSSQLAGANSVDAFAVASAMLRQVNSLRGITPPQDANIAAAPAAAAAAAAEHGSGNDGIHGRKPAISRSGASLAEDGGGLHQSRKQASGRAADGVPKPAVAAAVTAAAAAADAPADHGAANSQLWSPFVDFAQQQQQLSSAAVQQDEAQQDTADRQQLPRLKLPRLLSAAEQLQRPPQLQPLQLGQQQSLDLQQQQLQLRRPLAGHKSCPQPQQQQQQQLGAEVVHDNLWKLKMLLLQRQEQEMASRQQQQQTMMTPHAAAVSSRMPAGSPAADTSDVALADSTAAGNTPAAPEKGNCGEPGKLPLSSVQQQQQRQTSSAVAHQQAAAAGAAEAPMPVHDEQQQQQRQLHLQQQRRACKLLLSIKRLPNVGSSRFMKLQAVWAAMKRRGLTQQLPPHIAAMMAALEQQALKLRQQQQCCNAPSAAAVVSALQPDQSDGARHVAASAAATAPAVAGGGSRSTPDGIVIEVEASLRLTSTPSLAAISDGAADPMRSTTPGQLQYLQAVGTTAATAAAAAAAADIDVLDTLLMKPYMQQPITSPVAAARTALSPAAAARCGGHSSSSSLADTQQQWEALTSVMDHELSLLADLWEEDDVSAEQLDGDMCPAAAAAALSSDSLAGLDDSEALCL